MLTEQKNSYLGKLMLLMATIIWGSSFFILKNTIDIFPTFFVLAIRFSLGAVIFAVVFIKKLITMNKSTFIKGMALGVVLAAGYALQTIGLENTTPAKNAFLTATYCVIVPFIGWVLFKKKPNIYNLIAAVMCVAGIGFISLNNNFSMQSGDLITLACGIFYAFQIILISRYANKTDMIQLLLVEFLTVGIIFWVMSLTLESDSYPIKVSFIEFLPILYLTIFGTVIAQMCQMFGQKVTLPNEASLILSLEAVFGTIFSVIFYKENLTVRLIVGFAIIFLALVISETKLEFIKKGIYKIKTKIEYKKIKQDVEDKDD